METKMILCLFSALFLTTNAIDIKTSSGLVRGLSINVLNQTINQFLGIPFAEPPIGSLRFAKPKPIVKPNEGIIDATKPKNSCIQKYAEYVGNITVSEDCLVLNIWSQKTENSTKLKPVMFWIYGGGLGYGSIFQTNFNGSVLAAQDVVLVATNYRLGALGFLYSGDVSAPGNVGFFDQLLALKWVNENIHLFGGDKNKITIFGESAGSESVSAHILSPLSKGLFKRAILQSGATLDYKNRPQLKSDALNNSKQFAKQVNCTDDKEWVDCLRKVDAKHFTDISDSVTNVVDGTEFLPVSTQTAFAESKFNKDIDIIAGVVKDEGSNLAEAISYEIYTKNLTRQDFLDFVNKTGRFFHDQHMDPETIANFYLKGVNTSDSEAIKWKIFDFFGDRLLKCPTYLFTKWYANQSQPEANVYFYELTYAAVGVQPWDKKELGICHGSDIPFTFGLLLLNPNKTSANNIEMTRDFIKLWTDFAKTGTPDTNWPKFIDTKSHSTITQVKDLNPFNKKKYFNHLFDDNCDGFWKSYFGNYP